MIITPYGEEGLRIILGSEVNQEVHRKVLRCYTLLTSLKNRSIIDIIPSFCSCVVVFDCESVQFEEMKDMITRALEDMDKVDLPKPNYFEIPVRYGGEYGPDMDFVCNYTGLSEREVIVLHSETQYTVFAVGFTPGFPYLGPLHPKLHVPRLETPRTEVPAGSVGIALNQTGIYTFKSPGGWRLIGRSEVQLFDYTQPPYSLLKIGDVVRFVTHD
ncbi:MAG: 5-oxoprolinase subunit PxpB [Syntrophales bacterium]|nr:5-oxoprolinase subunit PxpB [Syntrophales bacterium]